MVRRTQNWAPAASWPQDSAGTAQSHNMIRRRPVKGQELRNLVVLSQALPVYSDDENINIKCKVACRLLVTILSEESAGQK